MKILKYLLIIHLIVQILFLDFDDPLNWVINRNAYINILIAVLLLFGNIYIRKKRITEAN